MKRIQSNQKPSRTLKIVYFPVLALALLGSILILSPVGLYAQTQWTKDALNPILSGGESGTWNRHIFFPCVLFNSDSARYEMWFMASAGPANDWLPYRIGFAVSNDGINWAMIDTAVVSPDPGTWDETGVGMATIIREDEQYKMWYSGFNNSDPAYKIGYATSPDGISWTKHPGNPVIEPDTAAWEVGGVCATSVMPIDVGYKMWYFGWDEGKNSSQIGYATSVDGITWQKDTLNNPVLTKGASDQWDSNVLRSARVLLINDIYYMWYTGRQETSRPRQVGLATSLDGIQWTKYNDPSTTSTLYADSDPVLNPSSGEWDGDYVQDGSVLLVGDTLHMWYAGSRYLTSTYLWRIGHATSPFVPVAIKDYDSPTFPGEYMLTQNYPNPFNPVSTIPFELPQATNVSLIVYDIQGREVVRLVGGYLEPGYHQTQWDGSEFPSGIYIARLVTPEYSQSIKMVLLR